MSNGASNKIEITQSTLLKLLIRRGSDAERNNIVLSEGELGYTVDTLRLFVGDGATTGGNPVSLQMYYGSGDPTQYTQAVINDLAFDAAEGKLYKLTSTDPAVLSNWTAFLTQVRVDNATLQLSSYNGTPNTLMVKTISAAQLDANLAGTGLEFSGNTLQTAANQTLDSINLRSATALQLPTKIQFGTIGGAEQYTFPSLDGTNGYSLVTDGNGTLAWKPGSSIVDFLVLSGNQVPVGTIVPYGTGGSFALPYGYLLCNGATLSGTSYPALCNTIGTFYGSGGAGTFKVPALTASNYVYLIKYLEDQYLQKVTFTLDSSLTGLNVTTSSAVTSFVVPQNVATEIKIGIPNYVSKSYVDNLDTKVKTLPVLSEPTGIYDCAMFIDTNDRVQYAGSYNRGIAGTGKMSTPSNTYPQQRTGFYEIPIWDDTMNEYEKPVQIYGAEYCTFVLTNSGRVFAAGDSTNGVVGTGNTSNTNGKYALINIPTAAGKVTSISIGGGQYNSAGAGTARHVFALTESGSAFGWGYNEYGQLGIGATSSPYQVTSPVCVNAYALSSASIAKIYSFVGYRFGFSFAIDTTNKLYCAGYNGNGALGLGNTTNQTTWKYTGYTADEMFGETTGSATGGTYQISFLLSAGKLWGAGYNANYNLGINNNNSPKTTFTPVCADSTGFTQLTGVSSVTISDITNGHSTAYALMQDNTMRSWGANNVGQCGIGNTTTVSAPTASFSTSNNFNNSGVIKVRTFGKYTYCTAFALNSAGEIWTAGYNSGTYSYMGIGNYGSNYTAFTRVPAPNAVKYADFTASKTNDNYSSGITYTVLATDTQGNLYGWGSNSYSQLGFITVAASSDDQRTVQMPSKLTIYK